MTTATKKASRYTVICDYCQQPAVFHKSSETLYRGRDFGPMWVCTPCQAWVGVHGASMQPLGRLANEDLRRMKMAAHAAFDPKWKDGGFRGGPGTRRSAAYSWLAEQLGIDKSQCHIGLFDLDMCSRVIEVCLQKEERNANATS
jgi:hypothetical protein